MTPMTNTRVNRAPAGMTAPTPQVPPTSVRPGSPLQPADEAELSFARQALRAESHAIEHVAEHLDDRFNRAVDLLVAAAERDGSIVVSGMGKSGLIGQKISATLASLGIPSQWVHPSEAAHGDLGRIRKTDCLLALSYSGETDELVALAAILKQDGVPIISITKDAGGSSADGRDARPAGSFPASGPTVSTLQRLSTVALDIGVVEEACPLSLAPTSSTTATLALGDVLALAACRRRAFSAEDFARRHPGGWLGDLLRPVTDVIRFIAERNLPVLPDTLTVTAALTRAAQVGRRPGAIILVDREGRISGLFTDGDLRRLILRDPNELARPIADVMTRSPRTLSSSALVRDAVNLIREHRQDEIPIVNDDGAPVGLLDVQDLVALKVVRD